MKRNRKITAPQYKREFDAYIRNTGKPYRLVGVYSSANVKLQFECAKHGVFEKLPRLVLNGSGCQACSTEEKYADLHKRNEAEYKKFLRGCGLSLIGQYTNSGRLSHKCDHCSTEFLALRQTVLSGRYCPICEGRTVAKTHRQHTETTFRQAIECAHPTLQLKPGTFTKLSGTVVFRCKEHGVFERHARSVLQRGCLECNKQKFDAVRRLDRSVWEDRIRALHGDKIRLLGQYLGTNKNRRYRFKCYVCFNTWKAQLPSVGLSGTGCPHCVNQRKTKFNSRVKVFERDGVVFRVEGWEFQAISWLLDHKNVRAAEILTESSSKVPVIRYKFGRRVRNYYPDMFIPKLNRILEVKSGYTLGLAGGRRAGTEWRRNQAKARAVIDAGYKYTMLLMDKDGTRRRLPNGWYNMTMRDVLVWMAYRNADAIVDGVKPLRVPMTALAKSRLGNDLKLESTKQ